MGVTFRLSGNFKKTDAFLSSMSRKEYLNILHTYAQKGVDALSNATPVDSGVTANSWDYRIVHNKSNSSIIWTNSNVVNGVPIAIILQYGHATGTGGYVQGQDYINPAIRPIFDEISNDVWREVERL